MSYNDTTFVIKNDNTLWTCGSNSYGELGLRNNTSRNVFTKVDIDNIKQISSGLYHTYILKNDGTIWSCGRNNKGQLGLGDNTDRNVFTKVDIDNVKQISTAIYHTYILKNDGTVWSTGYNYYGQLGLGDKSDRNTFTQVSIDNVIQIFCCNYYTYILKNDGTIWSCGRNNTTTFTKVDIDNVKYIYCINNHTYILKNDGTVWAAGNNGYGQLGLGDNTDRNVFTKVDIDNVKQIACGSSHTYILKNDGTIWSCGRNNNGQLGLGDNTDRNVFTKVDIDNVKQISTGINHICALKKDGTVWAAGNNGQGQLGLGDNTDRNVFTKVDIDNVLYIDDYIKKLFLIESNTLFYTISNNILTQVTEPISKNIIDNQGVDISTISSNISILPDNFILISDENFNTIVKSIKSNKQLIVAKDDFLTTFYENIDYFKVICTKSELANIKIAFSIDNGTTWKSYDGEKFIDLTLTLPLKQYSILSPDEILQWNAAKDTIFTQGISVDQLELINFNSLNMTKIRFAYVLSVESKNDTIANKTLKWQFDAKGKLWRTKYTECTALVYNNELKITPLINADMIKVNISHI